MNAKPQAAVIAALLTGVAALSFAQDKPAPSPLAAPKSAKPTLDELLNIPAPKQPATPGKTDMTKPAAEPEPIKVQGETGGDPFEMAVFDMKFAAGRLSEQSDAGIDTQRSQERAIRRLDQLIKQLQDQNKNQKGSPQQNQKQDQGSQQNASQPQQGADRNKGPVSDSRDERERAGKIEDGQRKDQPLTEKLSEWGNLPPRLRDQLMQGMEDRFSTMYKQLTERYYKRLAEEATP